MARRYIKKVNPDDLRAFGIDGYNDGYVNSDPEVDLNDNPAKVARERRQEILEYLDTFPAWEAAREHYGNTEQARQVFRRYLQAYERGMIDRIKDIQERLRRDAEYDED